MALEFDDLSRRNQWLVIGGLAAAAIFAFWQQVWSPNQVEMSEIDSQIRQMESEIQRVQAVAQRLPDLEEEMQRLQEQLDLLRHILPEEREEDELLRQVQAAAADANLNVGRFTPRPPVSHEVYAEYPLELQLSGSYHDLAGFFDRVSKFARIINVNEVTMRSNTGSGEDTLEATCQAVTFIFLDEDATESGEQEGADEGRTAGGAP